MATSEPATFPPWAGKTWNHAQDAEGAENTAQSSAPQRRRFSALHSHRHFVGAMAGLELAVAAPHLVVLAEDGVHGVLPRAAAGDDPPVVEALRLPRRQRERLGRGRARARAAAGRV